MTTPDIEMALAPVVDALEAVGAPYHVGGSVASSAYGLGRSTLDVDIVADLRQGQVKGFVQRLQGTYYIDEDSIRSAIRNHASFNVIHLANMFKVDVFVLKDRPFEQEAFRRRRPDTLATGPGARTYFFATAEDTLLHKLYWFRLGSDVSDRQWGDIRGLVQVQLDALDMDHVRRWADELDVADLLERVLTEVAASDETGGAGGVVSDGEVR